MIAQLPWAGQEERVELIRWFAQVGEPAYPRLLELAQDPRRDVAGVALAALGATGDQRLVESVQRLSLPDEASTDLVLERARTLMRLGDWGQVPVLIDGLESESWWMRAVAADALHEGTKERHGFHPRGTDEERAAAVVRWRSWWQALSTDPLRKP